MSPGAAHYSLWLLPQAGAAARLAVVISELSERHRGPQFAPHLTLLSGLAGSELSLAALTRRLAARLPRLRLRALGLGGEGEYFRCLYLELGRSAALRAARRAACALFGRDARAAYSPHVSLMYGEITPGIKIALQAELSSHLPAALTVDRLQLVRTGVDVTDWRTVVTYTLPAH